MRRAVVNNGQIKFQYPEEICFVFNPNYLEIESESISSLLVDVSFYFNSQKMKSYSINVDLFENKTSVYLSRLFELMLPEPSIVRSLPLTIRILSADGNSVYFSFTTIAIWGSLAPGERFHTLGAYSANPMKPYYERNLIWFKNFPFRVSVFKNKSNVSFNGRQDNGTYFITFDEGEDSFAVSSIDEYTNQKYVSGTIARPEYLTYFASLRKILAFYNGNWYWKWNANGSIPEYSEMCNEETGLPRTDVTFEVKDKDGYEWIYQFDGENFVRIGLKQSVGFCYLNPSRIFPSAKRNATIAYNLSKNLPSTFDNTFDYTFRGITDESSVIVNLIISDANEGHYLRWVDTHGYLQYFLFRKGTRTYKTNLGDDKVIDEVSYNGMYFSNNGRSINLSVNETYKCCATGLPPEIYCWVRSVITSPIVDLFLGTDSNDNEIWIPVKVQATSYNYKYKEKIHDLELTVQVSGYVAQSL